jgi:hypothetical protein
MIRFVRFLITIAVVSAAAFLAYEFGVKPRRMLEDQIRQQRDAISRLEREKAQLETFIAILKHTERRARIEVLHQGPNDQGKLETAIRFTETDANGKPISASRDFTLPGNEVYIDTLVIKFDDDFVQKSDPLKGHALMLFRRIFSSTMRAEDGFVIDLQGRVPGPYSAAAPSPFEQELWTRFWELANDEHLAQQHGVRAIHGDAPYMRVEPGRVYEILLRSTGEVIIAPGARVGNSSAA